MPNPSASPPEETTPPDVGASDAIPPVYHVHRWRAYPGPLPDYRRNSQMWQGARAHVRCEDCRMRTWLSEEEFMLAQRIR